MTRARTVPQPGWLYVDQIPGLPIAQRIAQAGCDRARLPGATSQSKRSVAAFLGNRRSWPQERVDRLLDAIAGRPVAAPPPAAVRVHIDSVPGGAAGVRSRLHAAGMGQIDAARAAGITAGMLSNWLAGRKTLTDQTVAKIDKR
jgi:hypothetical protein